ncbi:MAG: c-type cytochrome [Burkholderiaceae bacterium]
MTPSAIAAVAAATLFVSATLATAAAAVFIWIGGYDVSSLSQHRQPVYSLLAEAMAWSVRVRARTIEQPPDFASRAERGAIVYRDRCEQCHGGPAVAQGEIGRSMQPLPGPLVDASARWHVRELYWITRNGIKMSGMPAWAYRIPDDDIWAVVAFLDRMPLLLPSDYRRLTGADGQPRAEPRTASRAAEASTALARAAPDPARGRTALHQFACNACHVIPGVTGSDVHVGPPLAGMARRQLIAGAVPNAADRMIQWIVDPQSIDPETAMPAMEVPQSDAADMAAYLATLR